MDEKYSRTDNVGKQVMKLQKKTNACKKKTLKVLKKRKIGKVLRKIAVKSL